MNKQEVLKKLKSYGKEVAIASGDNFPSIKVLDAMGIPLYHPITKKKLTGDEKKYRDGGGQPSLAYFDKNDESSFVSIFPPQDFPSRLKEGLVKIVIGAGYDIQLNSARIVDIEHLNGSYNDPVERGKVMGDQLCKIGYRGVNLELRPVTYPLLTLRKYNIETLDELKKRDYIIAISEMPNLLNKFCKLKGIKAEKILGAFGGADNQLICGIADIATDIVETGNTLLNYVDKVRLVKDNNDKMVTMIYSTPWILTTENEYKKNQKFFDNLFSLVEEAVDSIKKENSDLFKEKYIDFQKKFEEEEDNLGLV